MSVTIQLMTGSENCRLCARGTHHRTSSTWTRQAFSRDTPKITFKVKGEVCTGGKRSKERLTIVLCAGMTGEKLPALVIEKCKKPHCFKKITPKALHVIYTSNKKAWMNSALFQWWLETFN